MLRKKKTTPLKGLICPFCSNDKLVIYLDFKNKKTSLKNKAVCIKTAFKSKLLGRPMIRGCGKEFNVKSKESLWPKL